MSSSAGFPAPDGGSPWGTRVNARLRRHRLSIHECAERLRVWPLSLNDFAEARRLTACGEPHEFHDVEGGSSAVLLEIADQLLLSQRAAASRPSQASSDRAQRQER